MPLGWYIKIATRQTMRRNECCWAIGVMVALFQLWTMLTVSSIKNLNHKKKEFKSPHKKKEFFKKRIQLYYWILPSMFMKVFQWFLFFSKYNITMCKKWYIFPPCFKWYYFFPCLVALASISSTITNKSKYWICFFLFLMHCLLILHTCHKECFDFIQFCKYFYCWLFCSFSQKGF